jgi:hypothetical protein
VYVNECIYIYIYTYTHTHMYMYMYLHTHTYIYICAPLSQGTDRIACAQWPRACHNKPWLFACQLFFDELSKDARLAGLFEDAEALQETAGRPIATHIYLSACLSVFLKWSKHGRSQACIRKIIPPCIGGLYSIHTCTSAYIHTYSHTYIHT